MVALQVYAEKTGLTPNKMSKLAHISSSTFYRYVTGEVKADIRTLVDICNKLHISIAMFIHSPLEDFENLKIYDKELWVDIQYRADRLEGLRRSKEMSIDDMIAFINHHHQSKNNIKRDTLYRVLTQQSTNHDVIVEAMNVFDLELEYLFIDNQLPAKGVEHDTVTIKRTDFIQLKQQIKLLEDERRVLQTKLAREERKTKHQTINNIPTNEASKLAKKYIASAERALAQLRAIAYPTDIDELSSIT